MKKFFVLLAAVLVVATMPGCSKKPSESVDLEASSGSTSTDSEQVISGIDAELDTAYVQRETLATARDLAEEAQAVVLFPDIREVSDAEEIIAIWGLNTAWCSDYAFYVCDNDELERQIAVFRPVEGEEVLGNVYNALNIHCSGLKPENTEGMVLDTSVTGFIYLVVYKGDWALDAALAMVDLELAEMK